MPDFKEKVLDHCRVCADKHEDWVWVESRCEWRKDPFPGVKICFRPGLTFHDGFMAKTQTELYVTVKEFTQVFKESGIQGGQKWAWSYSPEYYFEELPKRISFWEEFNENIRRLEKRYDLQQIPMVLDRWFESVGIMMEREFDFSHRKAFIRSLILKDNDPRIDDRSAMHQIGILRQATLRLMHGDAEYAQTAIERYPENGGFFREDIPLVLAHFGYDAPDS